MRNLDYKPEYRRHLPHIQPPGATLFVTFRLAGSIPSKLLRCLLEERELLEKQLASIEGPDERMRQADPAEQRIFAKWDQVLDPAQSGPFWLSDQRVAALVAESLHSLDTVRYTLEAYCIMPNHVHLLFTPLSRNDGAPYAMSSIMHSLKRHTGLRANQILARDGDFWQHENYDHIVRDEKEFCRIVEYVLDNPVSAGLVSKREEWQWSYRRASFQLAPNLSHPGAIMTQLGESISRIDAYAKVTGEAAYPGDVNRPGQLWMQVLFARRPHARLKRLDVSQAQAAPGVVRVFTASDVPVNEFGLGAHDAPVLVSDEVRWVGEKIALVVAETEKQAERARDLIQVEYEDLPALTDPHEAIKPGAPQVHPAYPGNVIRYIPIRKGDVEKGFAAADVIVEAEYRTPAQEHAYLQPEAGVAYIDDAGRVTVVVGGQWVHEDQEQIAHALGLPEQQVRVIYPAIGGAFGGREDMSVQIILALAAWKLNRPVKIIWSREESIIGHHKRHPMWLKAKWGATRDGKIVAAQVEILADAGPYMYTSPKVLGNAAFGAAGPYEIPNVKVDATAVATNNIVAGAFRGFGGPQAHFQAETQMNKLAEKLGIDPVELRLKNVLRENSLLAVQTPLPGGPVSLPVVVQKCADEFGWKSASGRQKEEGRVRRGIGFAAALKNIGFSFGFAENATATVELHGGEEIEQVIVHHAAAEVGQGTHTALAQMVAHTLGVPIERVQMIVSDTATTGNAGSASASRMTYMGGNAVKGASEAALKKWRDEERPAIATYQYLAPPTDNFAPETGKSKPNVAYGYVAEAAEVEVDLETGQVHVVRVTCVDDVGKAVNPRLIQGQIEGAVVQAQGWTIQENLQSKDGKVLTPYLSTYLIPGILDVPDRVDSVIMEFPDDNGPWGVRGMAEMPFIPLAPAIIAAVHDATGVWIDEFPLTPWRVLDALK